MISENKSTVFQKRNNEEGILPTFKANKFLNYKEDRSNFKYKHIKNHQKYELKKIVPSSLKLKTELPSSKYFLNASTIGLETNKPTSLSNKKDETLEQGSHRSYKNEAINTISNPFSSNIQETSRALWEELLKQATMISHSQSLKVKKLSLSLINTSTQTEKILENKYNNTIFTPPQSIAKNLSDYDSSKNDSKIESNSLKRNSLKKLHDKIALNYHNGKWDYFIVIDRYAWSCCMNYCKDSIGCHKKLLPRRHWCLYAS